MDQINDDYKMPFGTKKGLRLGDISDAYLIRLYDTQVLSKRMREYIENRIPMFKLMADKKRREKGE